MFPYPSGAGLHVGHPEGYTATDILSRYKRANGYNVLHPMGWDAFGLPAEQYALDTGNDPRDFTKQNIDTFRRQIKELGFSYDWDREVNTTDPKYYKWTQWIFKKLYEKGLAYVDEVPVNWCPALGTVLSNEEVIDGKSERGGHPVERRPMRQWVLKITDYAEQLLADLDILDWPESLKAMQRNWIGKSVGAEIDFKIKGTDKAFTVFTTRADTVFGVSYCVLAPEHKLVEEIVTEDQKEAVEAYLDLVKRKSDLERTDLNKDKTGVFTGAYAINPVNGEKVEIWIADYVLASYGTGAVMAVPAHDERDYEFATKFNLPIKAVIEDNGEVVVPFYGDGKHINSDFINGLNNEDAIAKVIEFLEENNAGRSKVTYKLRDWLFSRQRYWGEPIPIIHWEDGTMTTVPDSELPLLLPETDNIKPSGTGESPLANIEEWLNVVDPETGKKGKRETNTMPQWAGSCWYYLRYIDPHNDEMFADPEKLKYWLPVDVYIGGAEHAVLHLLYARFWHKVLYDLGLVPSREPFQKLFNQGMILAEGKDGRPEKMSKSKGNGITINDMLKKCNRDTLRYFLIANGPEKRDSNFSMEEYITIHNSEITNKYGNFVNRTLKFKGLETIPNGKMDVDFSNRLDIIYENVGKLIECGEFKKATLEIMHLVEDANKYYDDRKPWEQKNNDIEGVNDTIYTCVNIIANLANLYQPFMPDSSIKIKEYLKMDDLKWKKVDVKSGIKIGAVEALFERIK